MKEPTAAETGFAGSPPKFRPFEAAVLAVLFAAAICLPLVKQFAIGEPDLSAAEKRLQAPVPDFFGGGKLRIKDFPLQMDAYYRDHFGFRRLLVKMSAIMNYDWLHYSYTAVVGDDGWLFYRLSPPLFVRILRPPVLAKWKSYLEHRQQWLAARGIKYLFVVVPEKDSVYPEYLPFSSRRPPAQMPVDQLAGYLRQTHSPVEILYLKQSLLDAKKMEQEPLYFKQDGHWNSLGAFYGYQAIMQRIAGWLPGLKAKSRSDYRLVHAPDERRDIAMSAGLWDFPPLTGPVLQPLIPNSAQTEAFKLGGSPADPFTSWMPDPPNQLRAVMVRDSFTIMLAPYFSETFSHITYFWPGYDARVTAPQEKFIEATVLKEKPDVFIEEHVERFLPAPPNDQFVFGDAQTTGSNAKNP